jgi:hypothetical protein
MYATVDHSYIVGVHVNDHKWQELLLMYFPDVGDKGTLDIWKS